MGSRRFEPRTPGMECPWLALADKGQHVLAAAVALANGLQRQQVGELDVAVGPDGEAQRRSTVPEDAAKQ
eukprot:595257-Alexandrium_andersonii.AAC.1